jgi:hypothetical protein
MRRPVLLVCSPRLEPYTVREVQGAILARFGGGLTRAFLSPLETFYHAHSKGVPALGSPLVGARHFFSYREGHRQSRSGLFSYRPRA